MRAVLRPLSLLGLAVCLAAPPLASTAAPDAAAAPKPPCEQSVSGTAGDDLLEGTAGRDIMCGRGGNDVLEAFRGRDVVRGGTGDDQTEGGPGADELRGQEGADLLVGLAGDDRGFGGQGVDRLIGNAGNDLLNPGKGVDDLTEGGDGRDVIVLVDGKPDETASCGAGHDKVRMDEGDVDDPDCEVVVIFGDRQEPVVHTGRR